MAALKRLRSEFSNMVRNPTEGIVAGPVSPENLLEWDCYIMGPPDTVYEYGFFHAKLTFPKDYPMSPPKMVFDPPIWHPNIYDSGSRAGEVCISILHAGQDQFGYEQTSERWTPVQRVEKILLSVVSMLAEPNIESPAGVDAAKQWRDDREGFAAKVKRQVEASLDLL